MKEISYAIDDRKALEAFRQAPAVMERNLDRYIARGGIETAREMRRRAPKAHSELVNSIRNIRVSPYEQIVGTSKEHGVYVEEGGGPGGIPSAQTMMDWIRVKRISPRDPSMSVRSLAYAMRRTIQREGTPAQPYAAPTAARMRGRFVELVREGLRRGVQEVAAQ